MLPEDITYYQLIEALAFLSPILIILHGSRVTGQKFSEKEFSDLDVVCVSSKAAFWPIDELFKEARKSNLPNVDLSIITLNAILCLLEKSNSSSLAVSLRHGFTVIYSET